MSELVGFDFGNILKTAGGMLEGGASMLQQQQAEKQSAADAAATLDKGKQADITAANAMVMADLSEQAKNKTAAADMQKAKQAVNAAAAIPSTPERVSAAQTMLDQMQKTAKSRPKDFAAQSRAKAWQAVVNMLQQGGLSGVMDTKNEPQESFWTRRVAGPFPGYAVVAGGVGLAGVLAFIIVKAVRK